MSDALRANSLEGVGKRPFHLKLSFQLYDLSGKPSEQGALELWWAESFQPLLTVTSPTLGTLSSLSREHLPNDDARRSVYLISRLLQSITSPGFTNLKSGAAVTRKEEKTGKAVLDCMHLEPQIGIGRDLQTFCFSPSRALRTTSGLLEYDVRNKLGSFDGSFVGMSTSVAIEQREAIAGQIETLQSFQPDHAPVHLVATDADAAKDPGRSSEPPDVRAAKALHMVQPLYPEAARQARSAGTVLLGATITEAGSVADIFPIASPDPMLTGAAINAVKQWVYEPGLLHGKPVTLDTNITVNFNLNVQRSF